MSLDAPAEKHFETCQGAVGSNGKSPCLNHIDGADDVHKIDSACRALAHRFHEIHLEASLGDAPAALPPLGVERHVLCDSRSVGVSPLVVVVARFRLSNCDRVNTFLPLLDQKTRLGPCVG